MIDIDQYIAKYGGEFHCWRHRSPDYYVLTSARIKTVGAIITVWF